ncbi:MAG TPA: phosphocarrier protein HPr [Clostridiaceae bacterium]|nr:phosphocarrier protein HPr [Clostridiaceae bacterium]
MEREVTIINKTGLHARPATLFVCEANKYKCDVKVEKDGKQVNAKSIMGILSLGIAQGTKIKIIANGEGDSEAVDALVKLVENKFGEE